MEWITKKKRISRHLTKIYLLCVFESFNMSLEMLMAGDFLNHIFIVSGSLLIVGLDMNSSLSLQGTFWENQKNGVLLHISLGSPLLRFNFSHGVSQRKFI